MAGFRDAFRLSKQEVAIATPPGTIRLVEHGLHLTKTGHETDSDEIRLHPPPTSDPWDPLTWAMWRKVAILLCMSAYAFIGNFTSSSLSSALPLYATPLAFNPPVPFATLSRLIAINVLFQGVGNLLVVPLSNTFGRRPVTLVCLLILMFSSVGAGLAPTYNGLFVARLFMGIGTSPSETVSPNVIGEIFYTHQRGRAMGVYTVFLVLGSLVGGIAGGYIANFGLAWIHWVNVIVSAGVSLACLVFQPETLFNREKALARNLTTINERPDIDMKDRPEEFERTAIAHTVYKKFTFVKSLGFGSYRRNTLMDNLIAPFRTLRLPGVWLVMLWYAGLVGGVITASTVGPQILAAPPYLWGANSGLINVGGIVGAAIGTLLTVLVIDKVLTRHAMKKESGMVEAEDRLPIAAPGLLLAVTGIWAFGFSAQAGTPMAWVGMQFGLGMLSCGLMQAPSVGFSYLYDCYPTIAGDCFVAVTCMRAIVSFAFIFFVGDWVTSAGPAVPFGVFGGIMGLFALLVVPQWMFGKRMRIATAKWLPMLHD